MLLMVATPIATKGIQILSMPWHGPPMASALPLEVTTRQHRSGMLLMVATPQATMGIQVRCTPWHGPPMVHTSPLLPLIIPCKSGILLIEVWSTPIEDILVQSMP